MHQPLAQPLPISRLIVALLLFAAAMTTESFAQTRHGQLPSESPLWEKTFAKLNHMQLADIANAYDSAHYLMVPMHRAFESGDIAGQQLFDGLVSGMDEAAYADLNLLTRMQLDYFISEYLLLKVSDGPLDPKARALLDRQWQKFERYWVVEPFKHWASTPFAGVRGRLVSILSLTGKTTGKSYLGAATDFELFGLAIAANLNFVSQKEDGASHRHAALAEEAARLATMVVQSRGAFLGHGWLFQKGYWRDHGDFLHAGHAALAPDLDPSPVDGVAQDSSHSIRWSLWIRSFHRVAGNEADKRHFSKVADALSAQYRQSVIQKTDDGLMMTNFMDGRNGVYRYKYSTIGDNVLNGYGPNALSGSLFIGWLCFLPDMEATMKSMAESFPLEPRMVDLYTGPNTVRLRNPLFTQPGIYTNSTAELIARLSVECAVSADEYWNAR